MKAGSLNWMARVDAAEYGMCRLLNSCSTYAPVRRLFQVVSRLGDGILWYALIIALPLVGGRGAIRTSIVMAGVGLLGIVIYKLLKTTFVRERPFITHDAIELAAAPLDRYSFPSGHTLHAVAFTWQAAAHYPVLGWVLVPFTVLVAASRVVLGLHYPTDVLVGATIGGLLAELGLVLS
jgi:undecaprenyl-diphosphatase